MVGLYPFMESISFLCFDFYSCLNSLPEPSDVLPWSFCSLFFFARHVSLAIYHSRIEKEQH